MTGFLVTCDPNKEQRCIKEVYNVLNEWVEKLYPELDISSIVKEKVKPKAIVKQEGEEQQHKDSVD